MDQYIDLYCERIVSGFFSEPLNLFSNCSFFAAAGLFAYELSSAKVRNGNELKWGLLAGLVALVGLGSSLFHSFASRWSMIADVGAIGLFLLAYTIVFFRASLTFSWQKTVGVIFIFLVVTWGFNKAVSAEASNGSSGYIGTWLALVVLAGLLAWQNNRGRHFFAAAAGLFTLALMLRAIDMASCQTIPIGTHFIWHMLNGLTIYLLLVGGRRMELPPWQNFER